jgi:4-hydroxybenzoate polyprenyltransferase
VFGPSVAFIVNLVLSIVFLVKKRTTWLLSLLVGVGGFLVFLLGVALVFLPAI